MMMLTMTVEEIRKNCPPILSLEQVRCILHISKRKAAWLLQNGHIGCTIGEKKTRQYSVLRSELIKYIEKCSKGKAPSVPYGIFSTQKYPSQRKERAIRISQTTITNLKIELRAEWSKSPTVLTTTQAAKLVGCSNDLINSWMKKEDGLRFVRVQNGVFTTKEWLIDYFAHYTKENNQRYRISK